ncbi:hypothetical protein ADIAG_00265 [Paeniglutamicibacter gangotriensis Lz1y]|uniref:Uncharacterized protein n=1 Tax=Paeniglutamicibacter gangotriensis Lz1y TaxID=1276920 RepID=M7MV04_9MICC|nr:hypothetical protein ADIAG_00265 [Paeniglutamicibacter gangotriensis Lz1y]
MAARPITFSARLGRLHGPDPPRITRTSAKQKFFFGMDPRRNRRSKQPRHTTRGERFDPS